MNIGKRLRGAIIVLFRSRSEFYHKARRALRPMDPAYRKKFRMNLRQWLLYHQHHVHYEQSTWMGVRALKNPLDAWVYQEILYRVQPDVLVEIGSASGGSTLFFAHMMDLIGKGMVVSVDIDRSDFHVQHERIVPITGHSSSPQVVAQVRQLCQDRSVLVVHDGDHTMPQVLADLAHYAPLVSVGSYLIVEDGIMDLFWPKDGIGDYADGPLPAVREFLRHNDHFVVDKACERYILTYNPRGYLKRVR